MARLKKDSDPDKCNLFRFNLVGLIVFSLCLLGISFIAGRYFSGNQRSLSFAKHSLCVLCVLSRQNLPVEEIISQHDHVEAGWHWRC